MTCRATWTHVGRRVSFVTACYATPRVNRSGPRLSFPGLGCSDCWGRLSEPEVRRATRREQNAGRRYPLIEGPFHLTWRNRSIVTHKWCGIKDQEKEPRIERIQQMFADLSVLIRPLRRIRGSSACCRSGFLKRQNHRLTLIRAWHAYFPPSLRYHCSFRRFSSCNESS